MTAYSLNSLRQLMPRTVYIPQQVLPPTPVVVTDDSLTVGRNTALKPKSLSHVNLSNPSSLKTLPFRSTTAVTRRHAPTLSTGCFLPSRSKSAPPAQGLLGPTLVNPITQHAERPFLPRPNSACDCVLPTGHRPRMLVCTTCNGIAHHCPRISTDARANRANRLAARKNIRCAPDKCTSIFTLGGTMPVRNTGAHVLELRASLRQCGTRPAMPTRVGSGLCFCEASVL
ncbi:hypothetical protein C8Q70DRAFT_331869 [Cubamyces menziesii]|nr:hypothetical protein C8Q70DRAFT_331869 [Cubamyces menziesii]